MTRRRLLAALVIGGALLAPGEARAFNLGGFVGAHVLLTFGHGAHAGIGADAALTALPLGQGPTAGGFGRVELVHRRGWVWSAGGRLGAAYNFAADCLGYFPFAEVDAVVAWEHGRDRSGIRLGGLGVFTLGTLEITSGLGIPGLRPPPDVSIGAAIPVLPACIAD